MARRRSRLVRGTQLALALLAWQAIIPFGDSEGFHVFRGITFGAHEFGHLFFAVFGGEWLTVDRFTGFVALLVSVMFAIWLLRQMASRYEPEFG